MFAIMPAIRINSIEDDIMNIFAKNRFFCIYHTPLIQKYANKLKQINKNVFYFYKTYDILKYKYIFNKEGNRNEFR